MARSDFDAIDLLLIDGNNLLHRTSGGADAGALRGLLARLRGALPAHVATLVMLDGHPAPGTDRRQRIAPNLDIQHAGSLSADDALLNLVRDKPHGTTLVSDDRALRDKAMHLGAHTQRLAWLEGLLGAVGPSTGIGSGNRRHSEDARPERDALPERAPWKAGRGATKKRGNPRRRH